MPFLHPCPAANPADTTGAASAASKVGSFALPAASGGDPREST